MVFSCVGSLNRREAISMDRIGLVIVDGLLGEVLEGVWISSVVKVEEKGMDGIIGSLIDSVRVFLFVTGCGVISIFHS